VLYNRTKIACKCLPVSNRCRKLKWSMQTGASHRWCVNLDLFRFDGGRDPQRCLGSRFMSSIKCFDLSSQGHTQGAGPFWLTKSNFFPLTLEASHILLPVSQWKPWVEQEAFAPNLSTSSVLALVWSTLTPVKVAGVAY